MSPELYEELKKHLLIDKKPSLYLNKESTIRKLKNSSLSIIEKLRYIEQSKKYHPEGSVWNHTMMVIDNAAKFRSYTNNPEAFMLAALFHDVGKVNTTRIIKGRLTSYDHDKVGADLVKDILQGLDEDDEDDVTSLVRYHMHYLYISKNLPYGNLENLIKSVDLNDMIFLFLSDRLGRGGMSIKDKDALINGVIKFAESIKGINIGETIDSLMDIKNGN